MKISCDFCFRHCVIQDGELGWCRERKNVSGKLTSVNYAHFPAIAADPVEKKPLYHFLPGTLTLSIGAAGCNLSCDFCQNWELSQEKPRGEHIESDELISFALQNKYPSISFTYSEPLVWQDYIAETALKAKKHGIKTIMVSNGSFSSEALERLVPLIDAYNIDLKGDSEFYQSVCHGKIDPVLNTISYISGKEKHIEITTMIIEGVHSPSMIEKLGTSLRMAGISVWHLTRFFPHYKMLDRKPTSELFLSEIIKIAKNSGIPYIYPGNSSLSSPTICPRCKQIIRKGPGTTIKDGKCPHCGESIYGLW